MKKFIAAWALAWAAFSAAADAPLEIQARLAVVHFDRNDVNTYFNFITTVPANIFHYDDKCYMSPVVVDTQGAWVDYFHDDAAAYFAQVGDLRQLWLVGDVSAEVENYLTAKYGLDTAAVVRIDGTTPAEVAEKVARDWAWADAAVLVPYAATPGSDEFASAANGAALAAKLNVPLLFVEKSSVPEPTLRALAHAQVKAVYLVELGDYCTGEVNEQLISRGYVIAGDFTTLPEVVGKMRALAGHSALMTYKDDWQSLAAAVSAARHGGYCARLAIQVTDATERVAAVLATLDMPTEKFPLGAWRLPPEYDAGEQQIADAFIAWLSEIGGEDPTQLEWVVYFGPKSGANSTYVTFDRAIIGNPLDPDKYGALPGRYPGDVAPNVFYANRGALYRALIYGNPHPERSMTAFNSFVCHYAEQGYTFTDNYGVRRCVNEIFGVPEFGEVGVAERLWEGGYDTIFDAGYNPGTYQGENKHPINPPWHTLEGFHHYLNEGTNFFYYSGHGSQTSISAMNADKGCNETVPWGMPHWPAPEGKITTAPGNLPFSTWNNALQNIHGSTITFDACLCGAGNWNESGHEHGGAGAVSSYVSVSWEGSGWWWCCFADKMTAARPLGEALAFATGQTSHIYPQHFYGKDGTLMYYLAGDPFMVLYQPSWTRPDPAPLYDDYGGHRPGGLVDVKVTYFKAERGAGGAVVSWAVASPVAGFNIYREAAAEGRLAPAVKERINGALIRGKSPYRYYDGEAAKFTACRYWLEVVSNTGLKTLVGPAVIGAKISPSAFALGQSYPNPASPRTTIEYLVPAGFDGKLALDVYDVAGRRVGTYSLVATPGRHAFVWEGRGPAGETLAAGVYIYRLRADGEVVASRRLVLHP